MYLKMLLGKTHFEITHNTTTELNTTTKLSSEGAT
jgi:hypothetical protein